MTIASGTVALDIVYEGLLLMALSIKMTKKLLLKNISNSRLDCKNHTLFMTKLAKIDALFMTEMDEKPNSLGPHVLYSLHKGVPPPRIKDKHLPNKAIFNDVTVHLL